MVEITQERRADIDIKRGWVSPVMPTITREPVIVTGYTTDLPSPG